MGGAKSIEKSVTYCDGYAVDKFTYDWTVGNFQKLLSSDVGYSICSGVLTVNVKGDTDTFKVVLYPNGFNERVKGYASLWLQKTSAKERLINFTCAIVDAEGHQVLNKSAKQILGIESFLGWMTFCPRNILLEEESSILKDGTLTLKCSVHVFRENALKNPETEDNDLGMNTALSDLSSNLSHLFLEEDYSDFTIQVQGKKLQVYKAILSSRSPVFKVMLKSPLSDPSKMKVTDITEPIVRKMLNFMYSGKVGYLDVQEATDLYYAADKYELCSLKNICYKIIHKNLEADNVLSALLLGESHSDVELREVCIQYIVKNAPKVQEQKEWMELLKSQPQIANIVFKRLVSKQIVTNYIVSKHFLCAFSKF